MQAGSVIAAGADTCVFVPRVQCSDPNLEAETKRIEKSMSLVSRVVLQNENLDEELKAESVFQELCESSGLTDRVVVSLVQCRPSFQASDLKVDPSALKKRPGFFSAGPKNVLRTTCRKLAPYSDSIKKLNENTWALQTPKYGITLRQWSIQGQSVDSAMKAYRELKTLWTILSFAPDVIFCHSDLHAGNIAKTLQSNQFTYVDFGRAIIVNRGFQNQSFLESLIFQQEGHNGNLIDWAERARTQSFTQLCAPICFMLFIVTYRRTTRGTLDDAMEKWTSSGGPVVTKFLRDFAGMAMREDPRVVQVYEYFLTYWDIVSVCRLFQETLARFTGQNVYQSILESFGNGTLVPKRIA